MNFKNILKKGGEILLAGVGLLLEGVNKVSEKYDKAYDELDRRDVDSWSDEKLKQEIERAPDMSMKKMILMTKMKERVQDSQEEEY